MSGVPENNAPAFNKLADELREAGYAVLNPVDLDLVEPIERTGKYLTDWPKYLKRDIRYLVDCDGVVLLDGWSKSNGARLEVCIAHQLHMPIYRYHNGKLVKLMNLLTMANMVNMLNEEASIELPKDKSKKPKEEAYYD